MNSNVVTMSDSTDSSFGALSNWKVGLAVCVPCFAVGLGVTYYYYYYYSKTARKIDRKKDVVSNKIPSATNGIDQCDVDNHKKVG